MSKENKTGGKKADEKVTFDIPIKFKDETRKIPVETTMEGRCIIEHLMSTAMFDEMFDLSQERIKRSDGIARLTFLDGVVLVQDVFYRLLDRFFEDDEKDKEN
jgi:hypothetical protein